MGCDMCGKDSELFQVKIEETIMNVCKNCARFGTIIRKKQLQRIELSKRHIQEEKEEPVEVIVPNYSTLVKQARESRGLTQEDAAKLLSLKTSMLNNIERSRLKPNTELARKLEKFFKIRLVEEYNEEKSLPNNTKSEGFTLGDFIKKK